MEKPKISRDSRVYRLDARRQQGGPKGKKTLTRDIGKLTEIMNVPMDVFFEITSHLRPLDILQLSRSSKDLRNLLLSRNSRHIWIAARKNLVPPMPDCPDYMSEPQYAHLAFERVCHACGVGQSVNLDYAIPIRLCGACWRANVRNGSKLAREAGLNKNAQKDIFNLLPAGNGTWNGWGMQPLEVVFQSSRMIYYEPEFVAIAKQYENLRIKDREALQQFIDDRKAETLRRLNFNRTVGRWEQELHNENRKVEEMLRQERRAAIEEKLLELGYQRDDLPKHDFQFVQILNQPRKLTPRIWNMIRPKLVEILETQRKDRAEREFKQKWQRRRLQLQQHYAEFLKKDHEQDPQKRTLPGFEDALLFFRDVLTGAEPDVDLTEEEFAAAEAAVLAHADEYHAKVRHTLANVVRKARAAAFGVAGSSTQAKAKGRKGKGKGKVAGDDSNSTAPDEVADLALLEDPTSIFCCGWGVSRSSSCTASKTPSGMLEHWQLFHGATLLSPENVLLASRHDAQSTMGRLAVALGLPEDATLPAIEEAISQGRPACSCGFDPDKQFDDEPRYLVLHRLWSHINIRDSFSAAKLPTVEHKFTFKPVTDKVGVQKEVGWMICAKD
ncbi:hypothetical protein BV20DRAFT_803069 [Pilatotrama ljubarskyi]|nr:hypothetical protein BV20DRAFT_803069 [Pilatotrama ljubarskyi]